MFVLVVSWQVVFSFSVHVVAYHLLSCTDRFRPSHREFAYIAKFFGNYLHSSHSFAGLRVLQTAWSAWDRFGSSKINWSALQNVRFYIQSQCRAFMLVWVWTPRAVLRTSHNFVIRWLREWKCSYFANLFGVLIGAIAWTSSPIAGRSLDWLEQGGRRLYEKSDEAGIYSNGWSDM